MHKKFEINRTKIKGSCQSGRKVVPHNSKSDLPLVQMHMIMKTALAELSINSVQGQAQEMDSRNGLLHLINDDSDFSLIQFVFLLKIIGLKDVNLPNWVCEARIEGPRVRPTHS